MNGHDESCDHSEVQHMIMQFAEEMMLAATLAVLQHDTGPDPARKGIAAATMIFAGALETGLRAGLIDPIGAQIVVDHLTNVATNDPEDIERGNHVLANDARQLLEAAARL